MHKQTFEACVPDVIKVSMEDFCKNPDEFLDNLTDEDFLDVGGTYVLPYNLWLDFESAYYSVNNEYSSDDDSLNEVSKKEFLANPKKVLEAARIEDEPTVIEDDTWIIMPSGIDDSDIINTLVIDRLGLGLHVY